MNTSDREKKKFIGGLVAAIIVLLIKPISLGIAAIWEKFDPDDTWSDYDDPGKNNS